MGRERTRTRALLALAAALWPMAGRPAQAASPQPTANRLTAEDQRRKLARVVETARAVWGA